LALNADLVSGFDARIKVTIVNLSALRTKGFRPSHLRQNPIDLDQKSGILALPASLKFLF
jgi:hypothetical protein